MLRYHDLSISHLSTQFWPAFQYLVEKERGIFSRKLQIAAPDFRHLSLGAQPHQYHFLSACATPGAHFGLNRKIKMAD